jgi:hypothetical protein
MYGRLRAMMQLLKAAMLSFTPLVVVAHSVLTLPYSQTQAKVGEHLRSSVVFKKMTRSRKKSQIAVDRD